jgi:hypothetical protein
MAAKYDRNWMPAAWPGWVWVGPCGLWMPHSEPGSLSAAGLRSLLCSAWTCSSAISSSSGDSRATMDLGLWAWQGGDMSVGVTDQYILRLSARPLLRPHCLSFELLSARWMVAVRSELSVMCPAGCDTSSFS